MAIVKPLQFEQSFTADGTKSFTLLNGTHSYTVDCRGGFGGGTLTFFTNNNETSDITVTDSAGAVTAVSAKQFNVVLGAKGDSKVFKAVLTGSTSPTLIVSIEGD